MKNPFWWAAIGIVACCALFFVELKCPSIEITQDSRNAQDSPGIIENQATVEDQSLDRLEIVAHQKSFALEGSLQAATDSSTKFDSAMEETILGYFDANLLLEEATKYLDEPLSTKVDMEHWDTNGFAFQLGKEAHLLIEREEFEGDGVMQKGYTLRIEKTPKEEPWFVDGIPREGSRIDVTLTLDSERHAHIAYILTDFAIDSQAARKFGIDFFHGEYVTGAFLTQVLDGNTKPLCLLNILKDGQPQQPHDFTSPPIRQGNLNLRQDLLDVFREKMVSLIDKLENK